MRHCPAERRKRETPITCPAGAVRGNRTSDGGRSREFRPASPPYRVKTAFVVSTYGHGILMAEPHLAIARIVLSQVFIPLLISKPDAGRRPHPIFPFCPVPLEKSNPKLAGYPPFSAKNRGVPRPEQSRRKGGARGDRLIVGGGAGADRLGRGAGKLRRIAFGQAHAYPWGNHERSGISIAGRDVLPGEPHGHPAPAARKRTAITVARKPCGPPGGRSADCYQPKPS